MITVKIRRNGGLQNYVPPRGQQRLLNEEGIPVRASQKQLSLVQELICRYGKNGANEKGLVLDMFGGCGTTAAAALRAGFRCLSIEMEEKCYALSVARVVGMLMQKVSDDSAKAALRGSKEDVERIPQPKEMNRVFSLLSREVKGRSCVAVVNDVPRGFQVEEELEEDINEAKVRSGMYCMYCN